MSTHHRRPVWGARLQHHPGARSDRGGHEILRGRQEEVVYRPTHNRVERLSRPLDEPRVRVRDQSTLIGAHHTHRKRVCSSHHCPRSGDHGRQPTYPAVVVHEVCGESNTPVYVPYMDPMQRSVHTYTAHLFLEAQHLARFPAAGRCAVGPNDAVPARPNGTVGTSMRPSTFRTRRTVRWGVGRRAGARSGLMPWRRDA